MIKPPKLNYGDKIAAISLSWGGPGAFPQRYQVGKEQLEKSFGLTVVETRHALREPTWLARHPEARAEDLMAAFADTSISGIFSTIGGDDSLRTLPFLDLEIIRTNPKIFLGFSDTTVTHFACFKAGLGSFYGPSIMTGFAENGGLFPYLQNSVTKTLFSAEPVGLIKPNLAGWTVEHLDWAEPGNQKIKRNLTTSTGWQFLQGTGIKQGRLLGGCLEVVDWLRGTKIWPSAEEWTGAILFLETSEDAPSPQAVVSFLRCLAALNILKGLSGLIFGRPGGKVPPENFVLYDEAILQVIVAEEHLNDLAIITRMDFGHTDPSFILPYGVMAQIDCINKEFSIIENSLTL